MLTLDSGNVLLKPTHRKQMMSWLRRALRLGQRAGKFAMTITMRRIGRSYELRALVQNAQGVLSFRSKGHNWRDAMRALVRMVTAGLHNQHLRQALP